MIAQFWTVKGSRCDFDAAARSLALTGERYARQAIHAGIRPSQAMRAARSHWDGLLCGAIASNLRGKPRHVAFRRLRLAFLRGALRSHVQNRAIFLAIDIGRLNAPRAEMERLARGPLARGWGEV